MDRSFLGEDITMSRILVILGDQLFPIEEIEKIRPQYVFLAEDYGLARDVRHHKQKIVLFFSAMRTYAEQLRHAGFNVNYEELSPGCYLEKLTSFVASHKIKTICHFTIDDFNFKAKFHRHLKSQKLVEFPSPKFFLEKSWTEKYFEQSKRPFMKIFYQKARKDFQIMMDNGKPLGGKFSFDGENRKKLPNKERVPARLSFSKNDTILQVQLLVNKEFGDHPGCANEFSWPITRKEYLNCLDEFTKVRLAKFGPYQDAISTNDPFLYHSLLSPGLNLGLILPRDVLNKIIPLADSHPEILPSVEGLVRQILGWREFLKGVYDHHRTTMETRNFWGNERTLTEYSLRS